MFDDIGTGCPAIHRNLTSKILAIASPYPGSSVKRCSERKTKPSVKKPSSQIQPRNILESSLVAIWCFWIPQFMWENSRPYPLSYQQTSPSSHSGDDSRVSPLLNLATCVPGRHISSPTHQNLGASLLRCELGNTGCRMLSHSSREFTVKYSNARS